MLSYELTCIDFIEMNSKIDFSRMMPPRANLDATDLRVKREVFDAYVTANGDFSTPHPRD